MRNLPSFWITLIFLFFSHCTTGIRAQTVATAPAPAGPLNVTAILEKAGQFTTLIRLLKSTQVGDQINNQLNNSNTGLTLFAPTDNAFSSLSPGTLNSLTDQQKVALIQFHMLPSAISLTQFQTVSNPLRTQAGNANNGQYPLNVTTSGNQVNISTGVDDTTVSNTIISNSQLAVYQVDKVLLPLDIFGTPAPAEAPAPSKPEKVSGSPPLSDAPTASSKDSPDTSTAIALDRKVIRIFTIAAAVSVVWWAL